MNIQSALKRRRILVVGDLILDRFIYGDVSRISPEAPVPVLNVGSEEFKAGGAANVAVNLASLGVKTSLAGFTGNDYYGDFLVKMLEKHKIDTSAVLRLKKPTMTKTRVIARNQQVVRIDREDSGGHSAAGLIKAVGKKIAQAHAVIVADYGKGVISEKLLEFLIPEALKSKKIITVDPQTEHFFSYKRVTCLTPNHIEASSAAGMKADTDAEVASCGLEILKRLKAESLVITRGEKGMAVFRKNKIKFIPTRAKEVYDVTGAGDTVIAVLTAAMTCGDSILASTKLANRAAGIVVGKFGTSTVSAGELF